MQDHLESNEQRINKAILNISSMKEGVEKNMLTTALRACGGSYGEALVECQKVTVREFTEQGFTNKAAIEKATAKYPLLFVG